MKIGPLPIILIGFSIFLIAASFGYFHHYAPVSVEIERKKAELEGLRQQNRQWPAVQRRVKDAERQVAEKGAAWQQVVAIKTPSSQVTTGGINLAVNAYQLTVDSQRFHDSMQRAVNAQLKKGGVHVVSGLDVPEPEDSPEGILASYYNYPVIPFPVVVFDLGQTTVQGTYNQIMANVRAWKDMPNYLAVADGLTFTGTPPRLTASYNVTIVGYIRAKAVGPPAVLPAGAP